MEMESVMHMLLIVVILISMVGVIMYIGAPTINIFKMIGAKTANAMDTNSSILAITEPYPVQTMLDDTRVLVTMGTVVGAGVLYSYAKGEQKNKPTQVIIRPQKRPSFNVVFGQHEKQKIENANSLVGHTKYGAPRILLPTGMTMGDFNKLSDANKIKAIGATSTPQLSAKNSKGYRMQYDDTSVTESRTRMPQETYKKRPTKRDVEDIGKEVFGS
jgi:hypothetical protein